MILDWLWNCGSGCAGGLGVGFAAQLALKPPDPRALAVSHGQ